MAVDSVTENIVKGIIVAHSRTGITLQELAAEFYKCSGEKLPFSRTSDAIGYLKEFPYILSLKNQRDDTIWYVRGKTFASNVSHGQIVRCKAKSPNKRANRSIRLSDNNKAAVKQRNYNGGCNSDKLNRSGGFETCGDILDKRNSSKGSFDSDIRQSYRNSPKTAAAIHSYDMLGDDFFMEMAKIDLNRPFVVRNGISQIGLCVSGQTIRSSITRLRNHPDAERMKLIVNIGSVDILHGVSLSDMCNDFINLVRLCDRRNIYIVITTLAPLGNRLHCTEDVDKLNKFNQFLVATFASKHPVIDITKCMLCLAQNSIYMGCYQPVPKLMSGSNQAHLLWNRIGRQRILKLIKENLTYRSIY